MLLSCAPQASPRKTLAIAFAIAMQGAFHWTQTTKGFVLSALFIGYLVSLLPSGWLATCIGGKRTTHLLPSRRRIEAGEPFAVDIAGVYKRYHANVDRTFVWGDPEPELVRMNDAAKGALDLLSRHARAGAPVASVSRVLREYYEAVDLWQYHGYCGGYELGIALPPDWCGEFLWSVADEQSREVFGANLVTNYENSFRTEKPAYRYPLLAFSRDTVVYETTSARCLSNIPLGLIVLG